jgi:phage gp29-like protein
MAELVDSNGRPLKRETLKREVAGPTIGGVRSPIANYPADGLTPGRLAQILRDADQGEPLEYFELAEIIEERDLHYAGVLATRKRAVSQIDITVEAASDSADDVAKADMVRAWLKRDELSDEIFDMLDAIGKGISFTEIMWDVSEGQLWPSHLEWRDPRHFTFERRDLRTPLLRGGEDGNQPAGPLPGFKFIIAQIKAKSGLPIRSGVARLASWAWMFKAFTQRDWAIFTQTYGQPVRIGKFHESASKEDKATLFRAVANIAGDCAAIVPSSMEIEFVEAKNVTAGSDLYERRADWLDRQVSKAVLGQTNTTDAQSGGLGSGQADVHNEVRGDIEMADCKSLSAVINRDLVRPWIDLEFGPQKAYPRLVIARPKQEDIKQLTESLAALVPLGLRVQQSEVRDKLGLSDPDAGGELLAAPPREATAAATSPAAEEPARPAAQSVQVGAAEADKPFAPDAIAAALASAAQPAIAELIATVQAMADRASDMSELRAMLASAGIDSDELGKTMADALAAAHAAGMSDVVDDVE